MRFTHGDALIARLRAFAEAPEMVAIRWALPWSFAGLAGGLVVFIALQPAGGVLQRFYHSFAPAFGIMSWLLVTLLTFDLAKRRGIAPRLALILAVPAFAFSLPYRHAASLESLLKALGSSGLFLAIVVALCSVNALVLLCARLGPGYGAAVAAAIVIGVAAALFAAGVSLTEILDVGLAPMGRLGDSFAALLAIVLVETLLWTIGIHGPALLAAVVLPVYLQFQAQNTEAVANGVPLPHVVTTSLFLFVFPGGAGATLPLVVLLLRSKIARARRVAYATLVPAIFNANEPLMFGLPLISNPYLSVPFVIAPLVLAVVSWEAVHLGLVARPAFYIPSSIPAPISVVLATKDWHAIVLLALNLALAAVIYAPFVRLFEHHETTERPEG